jgi:hypothetical protein
MRRWPPPASTCTPGPPTARRGTWGCSVAWWPAADAPTCPARRWGGRSSAPAGGRCGRPAAIGTCAPPAGVGGDGDEPRPGRQLGHVATLEQEGLRAPGEPPLSVLARPGDSSTLRLGLRGREREPGRAPARPSVTPAAAGGRARRW